MPSDDFIDVRIIADDSPLTEYPDPEAGDDKGHTRTRYVEAKTGQSFGVQIKYQPGFDFEGAPYVYYRLYLDDCSAYFERAISMFGHSHSNGVLLSEIDRLNSSACLKDDATGEWKAHPFGFGVLGLNDSTSATSLNPEKVKKIGSIRVIVYRAEQKKLPVPWAQDGKWPKVLDEIPEKILKGKAVKNNIRFAEGIPTTPPKPTVYSYDPVQGEAGKRYEFNFLYRSRKILQSLGCIQRSPSPPPDPNLMLERTEEMLKLSKRQAREANLELMRVRAQLAEERRSRSTNVQGGTTSTASTVIDSPRTPAISRDGSVKRELNNPQTDLTYPSVKRERSSDTTESSTTFIPALSNRPAPPLFDAPKQPSKRQRDGDYGSQIPSSATKKVRTSNATDEAVAASTRTTAPKTSMMEGGGNREQIEHNNERDDDDLEGLPSPSKLPKVSDIIDLTDD